MLDPRRQSPLLLLLELAVLVLLLFTGADGSRCEDCPRDDRGRIQRSQSAKREFMKQSGYPHGRPGYIVDHVVPLACGGADDPSNMQWQTKDEAKAKDKIERQGCGR